MAKDPTNLIPFNPFKFVLNLVLRILLSPLLVLIIAYIYYEDTRKAFLIALLFYSALTLFSLLKALLQIGLSMMTFNLFKFVRKSFKVIMMVIALIIYWLSYVAIWGTNFNI